MFNNVVCARRTMNLLPKLAAMSRQNITHPPSPSTLPPGGIGKVTVHVLQHGAPNARLGKRILHFILLLSKMCLGNLPVYTKPGLASLQRRSPSNILLRCYTTDP